MAHTASIDIPYVARLARIELSDPAQLARYQRQLDDILGYIDQISALDLSGIDPTLYGQTLQPVYRDDTVRPGLSQAAVMENAPDAADGAFRVPRIVE